MVFQSGRGQFGMSTRQPADPKTPSPVDCHVRAEESYFGLSWLPLPMLSLPVTQTPGSSMTRGLCLDLAGWLFLPVEETSLRTLTQTHVLTLTKNVCTVVFLSYRLVCELCSETSVCYQQNGKILIRWWENYDNFNNPLIMLLSKKKANICWWLCCFSHFNTLSWTHFWRCHLGLLQRAFFFYLCDMLRTEQFIN